MYYKDRVSQLPVQFADTIDSVMEIIATIDNVEKAILFGSCSRNQQVKNSDVDLLLLLDSKKLGTPFNRLEQKIGTEIYENFSSNGKKEVDLLFADKDIFINSTDSNSVYRRIKRDGIVLYEKYYGVSEEHSVTATE